MPPHVAFASTPLIERNRQKYPARTKLDQEWKRTLTAHRSSNKTCTNVALPANISAAYPLPSSSGNNVSGCG